MYKFGAVCMDDPRSLETDALRELLTTYGVICFPSLDLTHEEQVDIMGRIGHVMSWREQHAPREYLDAEAQKVVLLDNEDFLGRRRMAWHVDMCYMPLEHLPIRSLACTHTEPGNVTQFADAVELTKLVRFELRLTEDNIATYGGINGIRLTQRKALARCQHLPTSVLRYDTRMSVDGIDGERFHSLCQELLESSVPKMSVSWEKGDFVVFDNNRAIHRRARMGGDCRLSRITSRFWL